MNKQHTYETLVENTLKSLDNIQRAEASPFLYGKVMHRLQQNIKPKQVYSTRFVVRFALAAVVLFATNVFTVKQWENKRKIKYTDQESIQNMFNIYFDVEQPDDNMYPF
jgi:hypothetical protein